MAKKFKPGKYVETVAHDDADAIASQKAVEKAREVPPAPHRSLVTMPMQANVTRPGLHGTSEINRDEI